MKFCECDRIKHVRIISFFIDHKEGQGDTRARVEGERRESSFDDSASYQSQCQSQWRSRAQQCLQRRIRRTTNKKTSVTRCPEEVTGRGGFIILERALKHTHCYSCPGTFTILLNRISIDEEEGDPCCDGTEGTSRPLLQEWELGVRKRTISSQDGKITRMQRLLRRRFPLLNRFAHFVCFHLHLLLAFMLAS